MKTFDELFEKVIKHEGYYANIEGDHGGETYMGVARKLHPKWNGWKLIDAYKKEHQSIKRNTKIDNPVLNQLVKDYYKTTFYDNYKISHIINESLQEIIFDWCVNSGHWGSRGVQYVLNKTFKANLLVDGIIGTKTLHAINHCNSKELFVSIKIARIKYYHSIARKDQNQKFLKGWLRRINSILFRVYP